MVFYITFLRCLAAIFITNSHYDNIYPIDGLGVGGLLGDVLFFMISGFCLYNIKQNFISWYGKRIIRIYPVTWIITIIYGFLGFTWIYSNFSSLFYNFFYPTHFHFIGSIIVLYVLFYIVIKIPLKNLSPYRLPLAFVLTIAIQLIIYITSYDWSSYHIDSVHEPMIRILYFECMLIGAYFREKDTYFRGHHQKIILSCFLTCVCAVFYFLSKTLLLKGIMPFSWQIINQYILILLLIFLTRTTSKLDKQLLNLSPFKRRIISFVSAHTLEIYLVQEPIIAYLSNRYPFPINFF